MTSGDQGPDSYAVKRVVITLAKPNTLRSRHIAYQIVKALLGNMPSVM